MVSVGVLPMDEIDVGRDVVVVEKLLVVVYPEDVRGGWCGCV